MSLYIGCLLLVKLCCVCLHLLFSVIARVCIENGGD